MTPGKTQAAGDVQRICAVSSCERISPAHLCRLLPHGCLQVEFYGVVDFIFDFGWAQVVNFWIVFEQDLPVVKEFDMEVDSVVFGEFDMVESGGNLALSIYRLRRLH